MVDDRIALLTVSTLPSDMQASNLLLPSMLAHFHTARVHVPIGEHLLVPRPP
jgi:hypothetical protein